MGRKKGSKNKTNLKIEEKKDNIPVKEIKKEIRKLKKIKLACKSGSKERIELHRQILALKEQLEASKEIDEAKRPLVEKIQALDHSFKELGIDLFKFSEEQLLFHIQKLERVKR